MHLEIIGRTLLGMFLGFLCGLVPLILGFIIGKKSGSIVGAFVCTLCGGLFGFLEKSAVLSVIVMIIVVLFLVVDKSRKAPATKKTEDVQAKFQTCDDAQAGVEVDQNVDNSASDDVN